MWRQSAPSRIRDSDEIISDEEDELDPVTYDYDCSKNLDSLCPEGNKVHVPALLQLDSLKVNKNFLSCGTHEVNFSHRNFSSSLGKLENFYSDNETGVNGFEDEDVELIRSLCTERHLESSDESISEEECAAISKISENSTSSNIQLNNYYRSEHDNQSEHTWSAAIEEANALAHLPKEINSCTVIHDTLQRRGINRGVSRGRAKLKFSFLPSSHKEDFSSSSSLKVGNEKSYVNVAEDIAFHNKFEDRTKEISIVELLENFQEESGGLPPDAVSHEKIRAGSSMADLLEDLQEENGLSTRPSNLMLQDAKPKERKMQNVAKRVWSHLGSRILDNEDPPEFKGGGLSSEDEDIDHYQLCIVSQRDEGRTMADLFQEAFSRSEAEGFQFPTGKQSGIGYHGRLQQILQVEKDRHVELLKYSKPGCSPSNDSGSMDVQILSRFLEAKLTVCQCSYRENTNISQYGKSAPKSEHDGGTVKRTVIFSSKICDNVELEVGNLIRILPPWKDVLVNQDEKIILCTYFCQIKDRGMEAPVCAAVSSLS